MKKLRKAGIMLCVLAVLLSLCACEQNAEDSDKWVGWQLLYKGAINDAGYYFVDDSLLLNYVDFRSGACVCLCSKAGCTHGKDCDAKIMWDNLGSMFTWEDGLYYTQYDAYGNCLYRRNADGTGESKVATLCEKYIEEDPEVQAEVLGFTPAGNYVYYYADISSVVVNEDNVSVHQTKVKAFLRMDLRTGTEEILVEEYGTNGLGIIAVRNDSAIYSVSSYPDADRDSEEYSKLLAQCPVKVLQWNAETGESEVLMEKTRAELGSSINYCDGNFYTSIDDNIYTIDFETGEFTLDERRIVETGKLSRINWDYAFWRDPDTGYYHLKDLNTGELLPTEIGEGIPDIECASDEVLIIEKRVEMEDGKKDGFFMFVKIDDLADGIQAKDIHEFYVLQYD